MKRPWINPRQRLTDLDLLTLFEVQLLQDTADLGPHRGRVERRHAANGTDHDPDVLPDGLEILIIAALTFPCLAIVAAVFGRPYFAALVLRPRKETGSRWKNSPPVATGLRLPRPSLQLHEVIVQAHIEGVESVLACCAAAADPVVMNVFSRGVDMAAQRISRAETRDQSRRGAGRTDTGGAARVGRQIE